MFTLLESIKMSERVLTCFFSAIFTAKAFVVPIDANPRSVKLFPLDLFRDRRWQDATVIKLPTHAEDFIKKVVPT